MDYALHLLPIPAMTAVHRIALVEEAGFEPA